MHFSHVRWAIQTLRWAKTLMPWQRCNHFRNSKELCRKDLLLKNLKKRQAHLRSEGRAAEADACDFMPASYTLPQEYALFADHFRRDPGIWIFKPVGGAEGAGIFLLTRLSQAETWR
ncbi:unnamed protein product, partial [Phaeothamnion confervicola]